MKATAFETSSSVLVSFIDVVAIIKITKIARNAAPETLLKPVLLLACQFLAISSRVIILL